MMEKEVPMLNPDLLKILCCPACKGELDYDARAATLTCRSCKRVYEVKNDIPIMIVDDGQRRDR